MKAIILSAGRGSRLFPLTIETPKCLVPVKGGRPILGVQLEALAECGVDEAVVVVGFGADHVDRYIAENPVPGIHVRTLLNPFYDRSDNLMSCWIARSEMDEDFLLMNGDTMWDPAVGEALLASPPAPITVTINVKDEYDEDDMKVTTDGSTRLRAVSKQLSGIVDGEAIGVIAFRGEGPKIFRNALERVAREPEAMSDYYLRVIESLAPWVNIRTESITGLWWGEVDTHEDLEEVREALGAMESMVPVVFKGRFEQVPMRVVR